MLSMDAVICLLVHFATAYILVAVNMKCRSFAGIAYREPDGSAERTSEVYTAS